MTLDKLEICKKTRKIAAESLYNVFSDLLLQKKPISEVRLRDKWLSELRKHREIFPDGWYTPPPHGISVLFATEDNLARTNFQSFRWNEFWPNKKIFLDKEKGLIVLYASMVNRKGIIGDFGVTLYLGRDKNIRSHFKNTLDLQKKIFSYAKIGLSFKKLYIYANKLFAKRELSNDWWVNITDPSGKNMGHTAPFIYERINGQEKQILKSANKNWQKVADMISKKRIFVSPAVGFTIREGAAFSIEPRLRPLNNQHLPIVWFHTIAAFGKNGKKELITDFDKIFKLVGMDYMIQ